MVLYFVYVNVINIIHNCYLVIRICGYSFLYLHKLNEEIIKAMLDNEVRIQSVTVLKEREDETIFEAVLVKRSKQYYFKGVFYKEKSSVLRSTSYFIGSITKKETKIGLANQFKDVLIPHFVSEELDKLRLKNEIQKEIETPKPIIQKEELNFEEEVPVIEIPVVEEKNPIFSVSLVYQKNDVTTLQVFIARSSRTKEEALGQAIFYFKDETKGLPLICNVIIEIED